MKGANVDTQKAVESSTQGTEASVEKQPYETPVLKEHGNAREVTLQTFFGTFSPDSPTGNN